MTGLVASVALGVAVGTMSSFLGVGGGVILVAALVALKGFGQHEAQATALAFMVPTATVGLISVRRRGLGNIRLSLFLGAGGVLGAIGGALLALALPGHVLRTGFAIFIVLLGGSLLITTPPGEVKDGRG